MVRKLDFNWLINSSKAVLCVFFILPSLPNAMRTATPMTRSKGEVACYSCFSLSNLEPTTAPFLQPTVWQNVTDLVHIIEAAGMNVPALVARCADAAGNSANNPNFSGAKVHVCPNTAKEPGACVKLKGHMNGEPFVYRDCWQRMWRDPRPFHHRMSGKCFNDEMVQNFIATKENTICFCEDDLCNYQPLNSRPFCLLIFFVSFAFFSING
ncbi:hypothetical protein M3Y97_00527600 [Aphelenchoides bicaudatus]|nr:hypothetical protein M3Y97_00527600 [Aphelenchoides bicaudatus]